MAEASAAYSSRPLMSFVGDCPLCFFAPLMSMEMRKRASGSESALIVAGLACDASQQLRSPRAVSLHCRRWVCSCTHV